MNGRRFDTWVKGLAGGAAAVTAATAQRAAAQDTAAAGNGGTADASANGGAIAVGDINSGGNSGGAISVGNVGGGDDHKVVCDKYGKCYPVEDHDDGGAVAIDGGDVNTSTSLDISADGGVAISDASGGDGNFAFVS